MPIQIFFLQNGKGVEFISSGVVTGKEIIEANKKIYNQEILHRLKYKIIDRSTCTDYRVSTDEIVTILVQDEEASKINRNITIAFVAPLPPMYGITKMMQAFAEQTGFETGIFLDRKSADVYINGKFNKPKKTQNGYLKRGKRQEATINQ
jgi:hypothetical protein